MARAPLATLPMGLCIEDYLEDSLKKADIDTVLPDTARHYCYEGDDMSIASLSSLGSGNYNIILYFADFAA